MSMSAIVGTGQVPVSEYWEKSLVEIAAEAAQMALQESDLNSVDAIYVGNAYGAPFNEQSQLGSLIADQLGLSGIEAYTTEAGDASGGAALRTGHMAVTSGSVRTVLVIGAEKATDVVGGARVRARNTSLDADLEAMHGATLAAMAALVMRRYMHEYSVPLEAFAGFSVNAHANGSLNSYAMYRNKLKAASFANAPQIADPVNLFDSAPDGDGAAAVVLTSAANANEFDHSVFITGSSAATDQFRVQDRPDPLYLKAVQRSVDAALNQAGIDRDQIDLFELHDAFTILSALTLEAAGYATRGKGWQLAQDNIQLEGRLPISTFGGLKSRGNPAGASGIYQAVEAAWQLQGRAKDNQVANANTAMIQSVGGIGSTVITHILQRDVE